MCELEVAAKKTLESVEIGHRVLGPEEVWRLSERLASQNWDEPFRITIPAESCHRIQRSAELVNQIVAAGNTTYGINTGVGALRHIAIDKAHLPQLQINLLRSHACGVGEPLPRSIVAAMWLHLLHSIAQGHRGIQLTTVEAILALVNRGIFAQVPSRGSVGASGDLAPAAHAALTLVGEGNCTIPHEGVIRVITAREALRCVGLAPVALSPKEGLSLINGTQLTTAYACQVWTAAKMLWRTATFALALSTFGLRPHPTVTRTEVLELHHPATRYAGLCKQRWFNGASLPFRNHEQDPYSFRCAPQVHGAVWKEIGQCEEWITEELQASTDNPIVLGRTAEMAYGGNFHAIYPARVLDRLSSAMTQLAAISERRVALGMNSQKTGLPDCLTPKSGLNSGLMMAQTTAAALVSECKALSFPSSVDSIPTNCDQEDHVSMGPVAGIKAVQISRNLRSVLAIEILAAAQAIHLRGPEILPPPLARAYKRLREYVSPINEDRIFSEDIDKVSELVNNEILLMDAAAQF